MPPTRRVGAYAKLLANYAADDAIIAAGEAAELLFVRGLAFCATSDSDGYITEGQLVRVVGAGMRDVRKRAAALVTNGLWESAEGGYTVRSWLKIHDAAEEKGRKRRTDRERKRLARTSESEHSPNGQDADSERNPDGVTPDSLSLIQSSAVHNIAPRTDTAETAPSARQIEAWFEEFYEAFPKKVAKEAARRRFTMLVKRGADPAEIIAGSKRYAAERRGQERQYTKQPDGWLNSGRWQDEVTPIAAVSARSTRPPWEA